MKETNESVHQDHECKNIDIKLGDDSTLNQPITEDEIKKVIKKLKHNIAPGCDYIVNAFITSTHQTILPLYAELFNIIFDTSVVPEVWLTGLVKPIYNGKGDRSQPESY